MQRWVYLLPNPQPTKSQRELDLLAGSVVTLRCHCTHAAGLHRCNHMDIRHQVTTRRLALSNFVRILVACSILMPQEYLVSNILYLISSIQPLLQSTALTQRATMITKLSNRSRFPPVQQRYQPQPSTPLIPDMILPNLYLTDMFTARGVLLPTFAGPGRPNIKYILSCLDNSITQPKPKPVNADKFVQKLIILDDLPEADLLMRLSEACDWIDECISKNDGAVLTHCQLGQSRSASIVIAYVMRSQKLGFQAALEKVKSRRSIVRPNPGFQLQLQLWQEMDYDIYDRSSGVEAEGPQRLMKARYMAWREEQRKKVQMVLE